jgi:hypothetical protein
MLTYHVTITRELARTQSQTTTVQATDAASACRQAVAKLDPKAWSSDPGEVTGEVYDVECHCEQGDWIFTTTIYPETTPKPNEVKDD